MRRKFRRGQVEAFFAKLAPTEVVFEACGGSHHWGRVLSGLWHRVRLIPPQYVKPFVKRAKNDRNDAEAISEAAARPSMRAVPIKTVEQQAEAMILKHREMLVGQRTQAINALRGHAAEFGTVVAKGCQNVAALLATLAADSAIPDAARAMFAQLRQHVADLDARLDALDRQLMARHKANPVSRRLAEIPGVGPITAITLALMIDATVALDRRQTAHGQDQQSWQRTVATVAGGRRDGGDPVCQARQQVGVRLVVAIVRAQASQTRGGSSGQQDGPDHLGHDGAW